MILWAFFRPENHVIAHFHSMMIILTQQLYTKAAGNGDLDKDDRSQFTQPSEGRNSQGSGTTFNGFDSQEPRTPNLADMPEIGSQENDITFLSHTSETRQGLSRTTISDGDGDASPTTQKASRKRGRESDPKENGGKAKRGGRRRG